MRPEPARPQRTRCAAQTLERARAIIVRPRPKALAVPRRHREDIARPTRCWSTMPHETAFATPGRRGLARCRGGVDANTPQADGQRGLRLDAAALPRQPTCSSATACRGRWSTTRPTTSTTTDPADRCRLLGRLGRAGSRPPEPFLLDDCRWNPGCDRAWAITQSLSGVFPMQTSSTGVSRTRQVVAAVVPAPWSGTTSSSTAFWPASSPGSSSPRTTNTPRC